MHLEHPKHKYEVYAYGKEWHVVEVLATFENKMDAIEALFDIKANAEEKDKQVEGNNESIE